MLVLLGPALFFQNCGKFEVGGLMNATAKLHVNSLLGANGETITKVTPAKMYAAGGRMLIDGSNFSEATTVQIGGQACANLKLLSPTQLQCDAPATLGGAAVNLSGADLSSLFSFVSFTSLGTLAGRSGVPGVIDGIGDVARFGRIRNFIVDGEMLYLVDSDANTIRTMDLRTNEVKTLAGTANAYGYADGPGTAALFYQPMGIAKKEGSLFVADSYNCTIRKIEIATQIVSTIAGSVDDCSAGDPVDGPVATARFAAPERIHVNGNDLYISDYVGSKGLIRKLDLSTSNVSTVAGDSTYSTEYYSYWAADPSKLDKQIAFTAPIETDHPVMSGNDYLFEIDQAGATAFRVHFVKMELGYTDDEIIFEDSAEEEILRMSGTYGDDFWSPVIPVKDALKIALPAAAGGAYGFKIDRAEYTTGTGLPLSHSTDAANAKFARLGQISSLTSIGNALYFYDSGYGLVRKLDLATNSITGFFGTTDVDQPTLLGTYATTNLPLSYLSSYGNDLYIADQTHRILKVDTASRLPVSLVAHDPSRGEPANVDGKLASADLFFPQGAVYTPERGVIFATTSALRSIR